MFFYDVTIVQARMTEKQRFPFQKKQGFHFNDESHY